jgi:hypothetical protein
MSSKFLVQYEHSLTKVNSNLIIASGSGGYENSDPDIKFFPNARKMVPDFELAYVCVLLELGQE